MNNNQFQHHKRQSVFGVQPHSQTPASAPVPAQERRTVRIDNMIADMPDDMPASLPQIDKNKYPFTSGGAVQFFRENNFEIANRTIRNYCAKGQIDCVKDIQGWWISEESLITRLGEIEEQLSNPVQGLKSDVRRIDGAQSAAQERQAADPSGMPDKEPEPVPPPVAPSNVDIDFLKDQIRIKDGQLQSMMDRAQETNILLAQLNQTINKYALPEGKGSQHEQ
jgi:hypothetical protein